MGTYLKELESWLVKWKMKMSPEKCSYTIFRKGVKDKLQFKLYLSGGIIPYQKKIKFLGITFDENLKFNILVQEIRAKCFPLLNIIKILSNPKWGISKKTLSTIYNSLIGSNIDYFFPCLNILSENLIHQLQVIQNTAIRNILKLKFDTPSSIIHYEGLKQLNLQKIDNRLDELTERYIRNGLDKSVDIIVQLINEFNLGFKSRCIEFPTPLCNCRGIFEDYFK